MTETHTVRLYWTYKQKTLLNKITIKGVYYSVASPKVREAASWWVDYIHKYWAALHWARAESESLAFLEQIKVLFCALC